MNLELLIYVLLLAAIAWSLTWKGIALWKCARNNQLTTFIALLVINTLGIFEIVYICFLQRNKNK